MAREHLPRRCGARQCSSGHVPDRRWPRERSPCSRPSRRADRGIRGRCTAARRRRLFAAAFERCEPGSELRIARLGFEFLRPIPLAPLPLSTRIVRPGRRVQELAGELHRDRPRRSGAQQLVCRASALRVQRDPRRRWLSRSAAAADRAARGGRASAAGARGRHAGALLAERLAASRASRPPRWRCAGWMTPARWARHGCGCACATRCCPASS